MVSLLSFEEQVARIENRVVALHDDLRADRSVAVEERFVGTHGDVVLRKDLGGVLASPPCLALVSRAAPGSASSIKPEI